MNGQRNAGDGFGGHLMQHVFVFEDIQRHGALMSTKQAFEEAATHFCARSIPAKGALFTRRGGRQIRSPRSFFKPTASVPSARRTCRRASAGNRVPLKARAASCKTLAPPAAAKVLPASLPTSRHPRTRCHKAHPFALARTPAPRCSRPQTRARWSSAPKYASARKERVSAASREEASSRFAETEATRGPPQSALFRLQPLFISPLFCF
ncbi:hypothetical protein MRX96_030075 [Rhipicephalus microplus]